MPLRHLLYALVSFAALVSFNVIVSADCVRAEVYPDHPVRIIVPAIAGGPYDFVGRLLASKLSEQFGQTFFVENRAGAGTLIGTQAAATAPPDGHTLMVGGLSNIVFNFALYQKVPYEGDDFAPVALVYRLPYIMVARNNLPQTGLAEIISYGRQSPGKLLVAHAGLGSGQQVVATAFMKLTGATLVEVPYRSTKAAYPDLITGRVDLLFDSAAASLPYVAARRVRGIALLAPRRDRRLATVPTMAEAGLPALTAESWIGLFAPVRTPPEILLRLRQETQIAATNLTEAFEKSGGEPMHMSIAETGRFIKSEFELWTKVIRDAGIRLD